MKPESNITFDDFLQKLGITEEVYILVLRSSIHKPKVLLKWEVQDIYIYKLLYERHAVSLAGKP